MEKWSVGKSSRGECLKVSLEFRMEFLLKISSDSRGKGASNVEES